LLLVAMVVARSDWTASTATAERARVAAAVSIRSTAFGSIIISEFGFTILTV